jgi:hypothetical protein
MSCLALIAILACTNSAPTSSRNDNPSVGTGPLLTVVGWNRVTTDSTGTPTLEAFVSIKNETTLNVVLLQCAPLVSLWWDPNSDHSVGLDASMGCPDGSPTIDLAPGDSTMQSAILSADALATKAPGQYAVGILVTQSRVITGVPAGEAQLPLTSP